MNGNSPRDAFSPFVMNGGGYAGYPQSPPVGSLLEGEAVTTVCWTCPKLKTGCFVGFVVAGTAIVSAVVRLKLTSFCFVLQPGSQ